MGRRRAHAKRLTAVGVTGLGMCGCAPLVRHATEPDSIQDMPQRQHAESKKAQSSLLVLTFSPNGIHAALERPVADV
jgi:hypothetical protein